MRLAVGTLLLAPETLANQPCADEHNALDAEGDEET